MLAFRRPQLANKKNASAEAEAEAPATKTAPLAPRQAFKVDEGQMRGGSRKSGLGFGRGHDGQAPQAVDPQAAAAELVRQGDQFALLGDHSAAERSYRRAIALRETTTDAHVRLGTLLYRQRRFEPATKSFERALQLDRGAVAARYHIALMAVEGGDGVRATAQLTWIKQVRPDFAEAYLLQATVFERQNCKAAAASELRALIAAVPGHALAHLRLGKVLLAMRDAKGALTALERACRLDPRLGEAHFGRGRLLEAVGKDDQAVAAYRLALANGMKREAVEERLAGLRARRAA